MSSETTGKTIETHLGQVEYREAGTGKPVLFLHGAPGGSDQGALMGAFLVPAGFRVIAPSRPGYLGTPLTDTNRTPDQQADLDLALMDALSIDRFAVMSWSGGGPSSYRLTAKNPDRVTSLVTLAAVSKPYSFAQGFGAVEYNVLTGGFGKWLFGEMIRHAPKTVVEMSSSEENTLTKEQAKALSEHIWNNPAKKDFVLGVTSTISGRRPGLKNDQEQFPKINDLGLAQIKTPTLLVHGTADSDVTPDYSENALANIPGAELIHVQNGTHLALWTDPTSDEVQSRVIQFLR